jgi:uncharacterized protein (DUF362 family)
MRSSAKDLPKKKSFVHVLKGDDPYETTREGLAAFPFPDLCGSRVLLKPNAARLASPGEGITTEPSVVAAAIDFLMKKGAACVAVGESCISGVEAEEAFRVTGLKYVCESRNVELFDFDRVDPLEIEIPDGKVIQKIKVPGTLGAFDVIVSIPVMKTHMHTRVTLSIKNMKGALWRGEKIRLHHLRCDRALVGSDKELDIAISDMASVLLPDWVIIDGTVGMEGMGPAYGKPKKTGMVVIGNDPLAADAVASRLMGFDPLSIPHLRLCDERGLGHARCEDMIVQPGDYLKWVEPFDPSPRELSIPFPDIVVHDEGSCSACLSTLLVFLQTCSPSLSGYRLSDEKTHVAIGKHLKNCPKGTIFIGNCTWRMRREGLFIQGCPPVASQILHTLESGGPEHRAESRAKRGS